MVHALPQPEDLVGSFRRLGETGPVYKVLDLAGEADLLKIQIPETGEVLERSYNQMIRDPEED
jgi:hypothetical protein